MGRRRKYPPSPSIQSPRGGRERRPGRRGPKPGPWIRPTVMPKWKAPPGCLEARAPVRMSPATDNTADVLVLNALRRIKSSRFFLETVLSQSNGGATKLHDVGWMIGGRGRNPHFPPSGGAGLLDAGKCAGIECPGERGSPVDETLWRWTPKTLSRGTCRLRGQRGENRCISDWACWSWLCPWPVVLRVHSRGRRMYRLPVARSKNKAHPRRR